MPKQITLKDLEGLVNRLNRLTGSPMDAWTRTGNKFKANVGNYHLDGAYGGFSLERMSNESGGVTDVLGCGHVPKRELYLLLHAFIRGIETCDKRKG